MDLGEEQEERIHEPTEEPVPSHVEMPDTEPAREPAQLPDREKVGAR
jgi:hypothetical protein